MSWDAQVLVLTHEDATWTEQLPYMAARCAPVQVVECFGRAARREPKCSTEHCVFNWWEERDQCIPDLNSAILDLNTSLGNLFHDL